jgi:hypothetical protein
VIDLNEQVQSKIDADNAIMVAVNNKVEEWKVSVFLPNENSGKRVQREKERSNWRPSFIHMQKFFSIIAVFLIMNQILHVLLD